MYRHILSASLALVLVAGFPAAALADFHVGPDPGPGPPSLKPILPGEPVIDVDVVPGESVGIEVHFDFSGRTGRNPQTGKEIKVPARVVINVEAGVDLSSSVK